MSALELKLKPESPNEQNKKFNQGILVSVVVHAIIFALFFLQIVFFSTKTIDISQAVRVDMVGLPDKLKSNQLPPKVEKILKDKPAEPEPAPEESATKEPEKVKPALPKKAAKAEPDTVSLKKSKAKQKLAFEKLKAMSAIERLRAEEDEARKAASKRSAAPLKGRVISAGTSLSGLDKIENDNYLEILDGHIKQYWTLPQWLKNKPYRARVLVKFDVQGRILSSVVVQPSGEPAYDEACLNAVEAAAPFPKFQEKFSEKYSRDGVVFGFPE